jgi:hypothetical protein
MDTMANPRPICNICVEKVMAHAKSIKCTLCLGLTHSKCLPNYSDVDLAHAKVVSNCWTCPPCLSIIFPFNSIEDSPDFLNSINTPINLLPDIQQLQNMVFDPLLPNDDDGEGIMGDVDPDLNFLSEIRGSLLNNCKYYYNTNLYEETKAKSDLADLSICHLNIRSLPKNLDSFLTTLHASELNFDVLAFTETWLKPSNVDTHGIKGYMHEFTIRDTRVGGGTSLFINEQWNYKLRKDLTTSNNDLEMLWVEVDKDSIKHTKNTVIGAIY